MAIVINTEPTNLVLCSTLVPLKFKVTEATANTTNIVASCFYEDQTTSVEYQIGTKYRMSPSLTNADEFFFDASEIFNTKTKYTLNDAPNSWKLGANESNLSYQIWEDIASWKVRVKFQREYLDSTTGLIVLETATTDSNDFFIHEGSPEKTWLTQVVSSNGQSESIFQYFTLNYNSGVRSKRFLTNYPIVKESGSLKRSLVKIHETEQFMLSFYAPVTSLCGYELRISTYDSSGSLFQTHTLTLTEDNNFATVAVGFRDLQNSFTPSVAEGNVAGNLFANVASYTVAIYAGTIVGSPCTFQQGSTRFEFEVDRSCISNVGYARFCFKNMLGGYDMVTSRGQINEKTKNAFEQFEKSLGFDSWTDAMAFGNSNWANENTKKFSVVTQAMKPEFAAHFAEMFSSTDVYLRQKNESYFKVYDSDLNDDAELKPYKYYPIVITAATQPTFNSSDQRTKLKFDFAMAVNQRNPRY